jgi:hypothetical protein
MRTSKHENVLAQGACEWGSYRLWSTCRRLFADAMLDGSEEIQHVLT